MLTHAYHLHLGKRKLDIDSVFIEISIGFRTTAFSAINYISKLYSLNDNIPGEIIINEDEIQLPVLNSRLQKLKIEIFAIGKNNKNLFKKSSVVKTRYIQQLDHDQIKIISKKEQQQQLEIQKKQDNDENELLNTTARLYQSIGFYESYIKDLLNDVKSNTIQNYKLFGHSHTKSSIDFQIQFI